MQSSASQGYSGTQAAGSSATSTMWLSESKSLTSSQRWQKRVEVKTWRAAAGQAWGPYTWALPRTHRQEQVWPHLPAGEAGKHDLEGPGRRGRGWALDRQRLPRRVSRRCRPSQRSARAFPRAPGLLLKGCSSRCCFTRWITNVFLSQLLLPHPEFQ